MSKGQIRNVITAEGGWVSHREVGGEHTCAAVVAWAELVGRPGQLVPLVLNPLSGSVVPVSWFCERWTVDRTAH